MPASEVCWFDYKSSRLVNLSTSAGRRGRPWYRRIVVSGPVPKVLIRGIGPTLSRFGVKTRSPILSQYHDPPTPSSRSTHWGAASNTTDIAAASATVGVCASRVIE